jgi:diaminopimelate epimerase
MELEFWKLTGAGNDFIAVDNRDGLIPEEGRAVKVADWCRRGMSVGADGVLLVEASSTADFRMRYYNSDGSEGETCGNGARCIARFAFDRSIAPASMRFETMAGTYEGEVGEGEVVVSMTDAHGLRSAIRIMDDVFEGEVHFVNTGVPHAVVFVDDPLSVDVVRVGRHLRFHPEFAPAGANVNFVRVRDPHNIDIRTYERGVENETLACGTGSIASAIVAARQGISAPPTRLNTASGEFLTVHFEPWPDGARQVRLQGTARTVFRGYMPL